MPIARIRKFATNWHAYVIKLLCLYLSGSSLRHCMDKGVLTTISFTYLSRKYKDGRFPIEKLLDTYNVVFRSYRSSFVKEWRKKVEEKSENLVLGSYIVSLLTGLVLSRKTGEIKSSLKECRIMDVKCKFEI